MGDRNVYSSGKSKSQQADARKLLEELGVSEVGEADQVHAILKQRYNSDGFKPKMNDIKRFVALVEKEPNQAKLFGSFYIFERSDGHWGMPSQVYLDMPYHDTGLAAYYEALEDSSIKALSESYQKTSVPLGKLVAFAEAVGVQSYLLVTKTTIVDNPDCNYLRKVPGERWTSPINEDFIIESMDELFASPTVELSRLVWRTMCNQPVNILKAR